MPSASSVARISDDDSQDEDVGLHQPKRKKARTEGPSNSTSGEEPRAGSSKEPSSELAMEPGRPTLPGTPGQQFDAVSIYCIESSFYIIFI